MRTLRGIEVPIEHVPDMIDEFPALFVAAACAEGVTVVRGAAELRVKESDRIAGMAGGLRALGICVDETPDGATVHGGTLRGGEVDSRGDHRVAMAFAVAAQLARARCGSTTSPTWRPRSRVRCAGAKRRVRAARRLSRPQRSPRL